MLTLSLARLARVARPLLLLCIMASGFFLTSSRTPEQASAVQSLAIPAVQAASPASSGPVAIEGWVTNSADGKPLSGARIELAGGASATSSADGYFSFALSSVPAGKNHVPDKPIVVSISASASGYDNWRIQDAKFYRGDILRVYPRLVRTGAATTRSGTVFTYSGGPAGRLDSKLSSVAPQVGIGLASSEAMSLAPPPSIRVYRTTSGVVEVVPFREYVKHVLPNEWIPSWAPEALKAGAMAVKSYGWYWVSRGGKQVALGADVKDNVDDQVYDPNISYASTDAAVDATFQYSFTRNGDLFQAQYCAGSYAADPTGDCPWPNQYMTQWGSAYHGDQGRPWGWILQFYYPGAVISPSPPGGGYNGPAPTPTRQAALPPAPPQSGTFSIGQGSTRADVFQAAYDRNGGAAVLGRPTGPVRWWLQYVTEFNVVAQPFSGPDGSGNRWLVFDILKATDDTGYRAFMLSGALASTYANHVPPGPEWIGAPTSDPYVANAAMPAQRSQGFTRGTLIEGTAGGAQFAAWPQQLAGWKGEFFIGHRSVAGSSNLTYGLPGQPASVRELDAAKLNWAVGSGLAQANGVGSQDWSVQLTKQSQFDGGSYDFVLKSDSGASLWIDGILAINGWSWDQARVEKYVTSLAPGNHTLRVQYFSIDPSAQLELSVSPTGISAPPAPQNKAAGQASLRAAVTWLGRGAAPSDLWAQPLTLQLSVPGNPTVTGMYTAATDRNGVAFFQNLPQGTFDVHVKGPHSLQSARASVQLTNNATTQVDMKALIEGDVDGDNCVTVSDFTIVQAMLGANKSTPGFNELADLNGDGSVTMSDISLLRSGFDRCGDVSADNEFQALGLPGAPTLSQQMAPWLNPRAQRSDLKMWLDAPASSSRSGAVVEVRVMASAGGQPVDGAGFLVRYDPSRLSPVDTRGNAAAQVEPGVALPSVMGNWIDAKGGLIGYSSGRLQGDPPSGDFVVATLRFRLTGQAGDTSVSFDGDAPSGGTLLTNGGVNLLGQVSGATISVRP